MKYTIKRNNNAIASVRPEGQLQAGVMGEETVTMTFSLKNYVRFQTGDTVEVYSNIYYLSAEPQVEKISSRNFRYTLEFQGVKYELGKVQYLFPDAQNVLNLSEFHIMGTARTMLELLVQNANRTGQGWSLGTVDETEAKQLNFSAENCLAVLAKIAQEFKLEYWVEGDKSIHLMERKALSGYSFEYGKAKGLKSLTRQTYEQSNIVTRLYAFGSEKNIPGSYRKGQKNLRMPVPYLEKNTDIYGVIEGSQTFDVFPHRLGTVTAVNADNPLQFTDSGLDFDLNERDNNGTKYLINGVPVKVTFNTGQLAGYTFEVKEFGYNSATKTFTLLKNQDEKAIEVPSQTLRPAVGDRYVLTDLVMPSVYITNAELELQQKAQAYLDENSRQRVVYSLVTDPLYFKAQNVNIQLGTTVRAIDADFNLNDDLQVIRLTKDLQNPYNVQFEVAERAEIAYIVRQYLEEEKAKTALLQADKFNAETARRAYRFGKEISENIFDGEGYFNTEKIKPLSIETKLLSVGSRMQQFALPDVLISVENATTVKNTQGKIVHLTLEENPREWQIPANTQNNISAGFNYVYIKAQRIGSNASVLVSPEKIGVESDPAFYHFEAGYLGSVESGNRRIRMSHGFTQVSPFEITTGRIAPPTGNHYIELLQDRINIVGNLHITGENINQIKQGISPDLTSLENRLRQYSQEQVSNLQIGGRNYFQQSFEFIKAWVNRSSVISLYYDSALFAVPVQPNTTYTISGNLLETTLCRTGYITGGTIVGATVLAPDRATVFPRTLTTGENATHIIIQVDQGKANEIKKTLKVEKGTKATDWSPAPEDLQNQITAEQQARQQAINEAKTATESYARQQAELTKQLAIAHADGKVSEEEQKRIDALTRSLQEAKTFAQQKVSEIQIGGRNLLRNSFVNQTSTLYGYAVKNLQLEPNKIYTLSANGRCNNVSAGKKLAVFIYTPNWSWSKHFFITETTDTTRSITFETPNSRDFWIASFYYDGSEPRQGSVTTNWYKVEAGNKATDWSPAPEDVDARIVSVRTDLQTALENAKRLLEAEDRNIKAVTQKLEQKTDFLSETKINGNTVATGVVAVGNSVGANTFISGVGMSPTEERIAVGANSFQQRSQAPFKVLANGKLHATDAHIRGHIEATSGQIGGERFGIKITPNGDVEFGSDSGDIYGKSTHINKEFIYIGEQSAQGKDWVWIFANEIQVMQYKTENNRRVEKGISIKSDGIYRIQGRTRTKIL